MKKIRLAVCIGDRNYRDRLTDCLMRHYSDQLELHVFGGIDQLKQFRDKYDLGILGDCEEALSFEETKPFLYLSEDGKPQKGGSNISYTEKYQGADRIFGRLLELVPEEVTEIGAGDELTGRTKLIAVYSLSNNEYQLPFAVTLCSVLGEKSSTLLVDLQENSGISQVITEQGTLGLEELFVMAENGNCIRKRIQACMGQTGGFSYIHPVENTESLCEARAETYEKLINMLSEELEQEYIILNLGLRFSGFVHLLSRCHRIYFLRRENGLSRWREKEFADELESRGAGELLDRMTNVEIPLITGASLPFERLVEQWKWNEMGDLIRGMIHGAAEYGKAV